MSEGIFFTFSKRSMINFAATPTNDFARVFTDRYGLQKGEFREEEDKKRTFARRDLLLGCPLRAICTLALLLPPSLWTSQR